MHLYKVIGIISFLYIYVTICGIIMSAIEQPNENDVAIQATNHYMDFIQAKSCVGTQELNVMMANLKSLHASRLMLTPDGISGSSWDFPSSIFMALQVISGAGLGATMPQTQGGKIFLIFYTLIGLGLFVSTALAIGEKLIQFVDWVRKRLNIRGLKNAILIHAFRIFLLLFVGTIFFGVIPAAIFSSIDPAFDFKEAFFVVSVAVVGYGQKMQESKEIGPWYRLGVGVWAICSLLWFASTFATLKTVLSNYNSGAIELPACCVQTPDESSSYKGNENNLNPFEENQQQSTPYATDDMENPKIEKAVVVMANPNNFLHHNQSTNHLGYFNYVSQNSMPEFHQNSAIYVSSRPENQATQRFGDIRVSAY